MNQDKLSLIKQIEYLKECIDEECQENLYYTPRANSIIAERIHNATLTLYHNAMRILRNQTPIIKSAKPFTIADTKDLMMKIYQTMLELEFLVIKENRIRNIMADEYTLDPAELLQPNPSSYAEELKNYKILHGSS